MWIYLSENGFLVCFLVITDLAFLWKKSGFFWFFDQLFYNYKTQTKEYLHLQKLASGEQSLSMNGEVTQDFGSKLGVEDYLSSGTSLMLGQWCFAAQDWRALLAAVFSILSAGLFEIFSSTIFRRKNIFLSKIFLKRTLLKAVKYAFCPDLRHQIHFLACFGHFLSFWIFQANLKAENSTWWFICILKREDRVRKSNRKIKFLTLSWTLSRESCKCGFDFIDFLRININN